MPLNNLGKFDPRANHSISRENSISNIPADQIAALVSNIANATIATRFQSSAAVERNFQDLEKRLGSLNKRISFKVEDQELKLRVKAPEGNKDLPIFFEEIIKDAICLSAPLPATLQKPACTTILHLLKTKFPKLTSSLFDRKIPRFVVSSAIPLNDEGKGNFFPQIELEGKIAYVAWDSSGSQIARGFKEKTCDILLKNKETFCGHALSQDNLEGIEKGAGVSAYFMTSKITVIGMLITESPDFLQSFLYSGRTVYDGRIACDSDSDDENLRCDGPTRLIARGPSSRNSHTTFGMLGVEGVRISDVQRDFPDRPKKGIEELHLFCIEIIPQFSSEETPVDKEDLERAIEMQFQEKIYAQFSSKKVVNVRF